MILVDIYVPSVDSTWDFQLDENTEISKVISELVYIIANKTKAPKQPDSKLFGLYSLNDECELPPEATLLECNVRDGSRLMLL